MNGIPATAAQTATQSWSLRRRLGLAFTFLAAVLLVAVTVVGFAAYRFAASGNAVIYRWQRAEAASARLLSDYVNQETGIRGYELSRDPVSLQPYRDYAARRDDDLAELRHHIAGDRPLRARLRAVTRAGDEWERVVAEPAIAAVRAGRTGGLTTQLMATRTFDRLRLQAGGLTAALTAESDRTRAERTQDGVLATLFAAIGLVLIVMSE